MTIKEEVTKKLNEATEKILTSLDGLTINQASHVLTMCFINMISGNYDTLKACGVDTKGMNAEDLLQLQLLFTKANEKDIDELLQE